MNHILLVLFIVLPFSQFLFRTHYLLRTMDMHHAHGVFFEIMVLIAFSYSLWKKPLKPLHEKLHQKNLPIALTFLWIGLTVILRLSYSIASSNQYNITVLPFLNLTCFIILYKLITDYLTEKDLNNILKYMAYTIALMVAYSFLQALNLDQFYKHFATTARTTYKDSIVGTIGNPTILANYLAICLPILYFNKTKLSSFTILGIWVILLLIHSASGIVIALIVTIFYNFYYQIRFKHERFLAVLVTLFIPITIYLYGFSHIKLLFNPSGRLDFWKYAWDYMKDTPITGIGLGGMRLLTQKSGQFIAWGHTHNELYNMTIETGLVSTILLVILIYAYFKRFFIIQNKSELTVCLTSIFLAFLLTTFFNFTAHLYMTGALGLLGYSGLYSLREN